MSAIGTSNCHSRPISKREDQPLLAVNSEKSTTRKVREIVAAIFVVISTIAFGFTLYAALGLIAAPVTIISAFSIGLFATVVSVAGIFTALYFPLKGETEGTSSKPQPDNAASNAFQKKKEKMSSGLPSTPASVFTKKEKHKILPKTASNSITSKTIEKKKGSMHSDLVLFPTSLPTKKEKVLVESESDHIGSDTEKKEKESVDSDSAVFPTSLPAKKEKVLVESESNNIDSDTEKKEEKSVDSDSALSPASILAKKEKVLAELELDNIGSNTETKEAKSVNSDLPLFPTSISTKKEKVSGESEPDNISSDTEKKEEKNVDSDLPLSPTSIPSLSNSELLQIQWRERLFTSEEFGHEAFFNHVKDSSTARDWTQKILKETAHMSIGQIAKKWPELFSQKILQKEDILERLHNEVITLTSFEQICLNYPESFFEMKFLTIETPKLDQLVQKYVCFHTEFLLKPTIEWSNHMIVKYGLINPAFQERVEGIQQAVEKENLTYLENQKTLQDEYNEELQEITNWYQTTILSVQMKQQRIEIIENLEQEMLRVTEEIKNTPKTLLTKIDRDIFTLQGQLLKATEACNRVKKEDNKSAKEIAFAKIKLKDQQEKLASKERIRDSWTKFKEATIDLATLRIKLDAEKSKVQLSKENEAYSNLIKLEEKKKNLCTQIKNHCAQMENFPSEPQELLKKCEEEHTKIQEEFKRTDSKRSESKKDLAENLKIGMQKEEIRHKNALSFLVDNL